MIRTSLFRRSILLIRYHMPASFRVGDLRFNLSGPTLGARGGLFTPESASRQTFGTLTEDDPCVGHLYLALTCNGVNPVTLDSLRMAVIDWINSARIFAYARRALSL
jgi:hypothetical protein